MRDYLAIEPFSSYFYYHDPHIFHDVSPEFDIPTTTTPPSFLPSFLGTLISFLFRSFDGKNKVWSIDQRACVATHSETDKVVWAVKWLPKTGRNEMFATAGGNRSISFYREATGG